jgi:hypothetical protein
MKKIFGTLICIFLILLIIGLIIQGNPGLVFMVLLGGIVGIPMGLSYPFPIYTKLGMILGLIASVVSVYFGFANHDKIIGQVLAVVGILCWFFIGLMGLGTGT